MSGPRRFDHDEAVARRQAGETVAGIAADFGVTTSAVSQAVKRATDPAWRQHNNDRNREYQRDHNRRPCALGCGRLAWYGPERTGTCRHCAAQDSATSVRADTLQCSECREWKADDNFPHRHGRIARRERHAICRSCQAAVRARSRERLKTPCHSCGKPRAADGRFKDSGLCRTCWYESRRKQAA